MVEIDQNEKIETNNNTDKYTENHNHKKSKKWIIITISLVFFIGVAVTAIYFTQAPIITYNGDTSETYQLRR